MESFLFMISKLPGRQFSWRFFYNKKGNKNETSKTDNINRCGIDGRHIRRKGGDMQAEYYAAIRMYQW
jgi:hypothetical protein